jgi:hypothetical protein
MTHWRDRNPEPDHGRDVEAELDEKLTRDPVLKVYMTSREINAIQKARIMQSLEPNPPPIDRNDIEAQLGGKNAYEDQVTPARWAEVRRERIDSLDVVNKRRHRLR